MNFYQTDPDVIFLLVLLEVWAQTEKFLHSCHIYRTYHHLGPMLALILKCCPVPKHTHKPGYDEKIVVKNYKKMHLRFLIHLFWFPHPYLMICYVNLGFGIHMKRIKMLVAWCCFSEVLSDLKEIASGKNIDRAMIKSLLQVSHVISRACCMRVVSYIGFDAWKTCIPLLIGSVSWKFLQFEMGYKGPPPKTYLWLLWLHVCLQILAN